MTSVQEHQADPNNYDEAIRDDDAPSWRDSIKTEVKTLIEKKVFEFVDDIPPGRRLVGTRFVFKRKRDKEGNVAKFKARLVAQGFSQVPGIDFYET